jgi:hypothetical protein
MAKTVKPTIETGAMTLVLLVKYYKSQMIALLLKNGVIVPNGASDQQIAMLMANLLKVSKSFFVDLNNFIQNPKVIETLAGGMMQTAEYFRMSGKEYMNVFGDIGDVPTNIGYQSQYGLDSPSSTPTTNSTPPKKGFFSGLNLGELIKDGLGAFGNYTKMQSDKEIARQYALSEQAKANAVESGSDTYIDPSSGERKKVKDDTKDTKMSTTTIVVLSLVGIAVIGTIIYFVAKPKQ